MKKLSYTLICLVAFWATSMNAYSQKIPTWVNGFHGDYANSRVIMYSAIADTEAKAREQILNQVIAENSLTTGHQATVRISPNGDFTASGSHELITKARRIDEHHDMVGGQHRVCWLVQIAKNPTYPYENVQITDRYNYTAESFVPGMAQLKKGQTGKGIFFIAAEAACVGTIIASESQRSSYSSKMNTTTSVALKKSYKDKANTWSTVRNIAIAGTAAFYIWNVVDGITAKGKKHIRINGVDMAFAPYYTPETLSAPESSGLAMRITF